MPGAASLTQQPAGLAGVNTQLLLSTPGLLIAVLIGFFLNLWGIPLFDLDEGAFAEATREMLASGNFAATYLDGQPRYDKPILSYWFQALSVSLFGINEMAFRLPSAIASCLWIFASYRFTRQFYTEQAARILVLIMSTTLWFTVVGRAAIADAWLNLFIALAFFDIWRYRITPNQRTLLRIYVWLALGLLTKGPVAVAIPFIASFIAFSSLGAGKIWRKAVFNPIGWLVLLVILSPWLYLVYQDQGADFFRGFLLDHNLNRFNSPKEGHSGQWFYYLLVLPLIVLPYSGLLFSTVAKAKSLWQQPLERFLLIWFLVVLVLVSVSQTKLPHYVLYGVTGLLIIFSTQHQRVSNRWLLLPPALFVGLIAVLPWIVARVAETSHRVYEQQLLSQYDQVFGWFYYLSVCLLLGAMIIILLLRNWPVIYKLVLAGVLQSLFVFMVLIEVVADMQQKPVQLAAETAKQYQLDYPDRQVLAFEIRMPSFSVYREQITPKLDLTTQLPQSGTLIYTRADKLKTLQQQLSPTDTSVVYQRGGILLVQVK